MAAQKVKREVKFFGLTVLASGEPARFAPPDWEALCAQVGSRDLGKRTISHNGNEYVLDMHGQARVAVHKKKQPGDMMASVRHDGDISDVIAVDEDRAYADSALVTFVKDKLVFAITSRSGGASAPRAQVVPSWLNQHKPFGKQYEFVCEPLMDTPSLTNLSTADGARRVTMRFGAGSLRNAQSELGKALHEASRDLTDGTVNVSFTYGNSTPNQRDRQRMLDLANDAAQLQGDDATASASILHKKPKTKKNPDPGFAAEAIDLIQAQMAHSIQLDVKNNAVTISSMFDRIDQVIEDYRHRF